jgi:hypothetical protein
MRCISLEQETPAGRLLLQVLLDAGVDPNVPTSSSGEVQDALLRAGVVST